MINHSMIKDHPSIFLPIDTNTFPIGRQLTTDNLQWNVSFCTTTLYAKVILNNFLQNTFIPLPHSTETSISGLLSKLNANVSQLKDGLCFVTAGPKSSSSMTFRMIERVVMKFLEFLKVFGKHNGYQQRWDSRDWK